MTVEQLKREFAALRKLQAQRKLESIEERKVRVDQLQFTNGKYAGCCWAGASLKQWKKKTTQL